MAVLAAIALAVDLGALPRILALLPVGAFALAFVLNLVGSIVVPAIQTRVALRATRLELGTLELVAINLMVRFYILVLPRPAAVGIRWWAYRGGGGGGGGNDAAALMVFERMTQGVVMTGALVVLLGVERGGLPVTSDALWVAALGLFGVALAGFVSFLWTPAATLPRWILERPRLPSGIRDRAARFLEAVEAYPRLPTWRVLVILGLSVVYFVLFVASFWVLVRAIGVELSFVAVAWIRALVFFLTLVPVTIAGLGVREAGLVALLRLYKVPEEEALAAALAALGVQLVIGLLGAGVAIWRQWRGRDPDMDVRVSPSRPAPE